MLVGAAGGVEDAGVAGALEVLLQAVVNAARRTSSPALMVGSDLEFWIKSISLEDIVR